ncbi:polysaccharide deacetylase family protein [Dietzia sp. NPDC055877]
MTEAGFNRAEQQNYPHSLSLRPPTRRPLWSRPLGPAAVVAVVVVGLIAALVGRRRTATTSQLSSFPSAASVRAEAAAAAGVNEHRDDDELPVSGSTDTPGPAGSGHPSPPGSHKASAERVGVAGQSRTGRRRPATRVALAASLLTLCTVGSAMVSGIAPSTFTIASAASSDIPLPPEIAAIVEEPRPDCTVLKCAVLTFDDGPDRHTTPALLDVLESRGVPANFFVLGTLIAGNEDIVLRMQRLGMGVENHTWDHPDLTMLSPAGVTDQLARTNQELSRVLGYTPRYMRPPYGAWTPGYTPTHGMRPVLWEVDPQDWLYRNSATVVQHVEGQVAPGDVILLHDIHRSSVDAVPGIIDSLHGRGYTFVTLDDLFEARPNCPVEFYCAPPAPGPGMAAPLPAPLAATPSPVLPAN